MSGGARLRPGPNSLNYRATWQIFTDLVELYNNAHNTFEEQNPLEGDVTNSRSDARIRAIDRELNAELTTRPQLFMDREDNIIDDTDNVAAKTVARTVRNFLVFNHQTIINSLRLFDEGTTNNMRIFCLERNASRRGHERRSPLDFKTISRILKCSQPPAYTRAVCAFKSGQSRKQEGTWALHMDDSGRALFTSIIIHLLNYSSAFIAEILENSDQHAGRDNFVSRLDNIQAVTIVRNEVEENHVRHLSPTAEEETLNRIYVSLQTKVVVFGAEIVNGILEAAAESRWGVIKPKNGSIRRVLNEDELITGREIAETLFASDEYCGRLATMLSECIFRIAVVYNVIVPDDMYRNPFTDDMTTAVTRIFNMLCLHLIDCIDGLSTEQNVQMKTQLATNITTAMENMVTRREHMVGTTWDIYRGAQKGTKRRLEHGHNQQESDTESVVHSTVPPRGNRNVGPAPTGPLHTCPCCEQVWPHTAPWPPHRVKIFDGMRITIEDDEEKEDRIVENTRSKRPRGTTAGTSSSGTDGTYVPRSDLLDLVSGAEGRTNEVRMDRVQKLVDELYDRAGDIPGLVDNVQQRLQQRHEAAVAARAQREEAAAAQNAARQEQIRRTAQRKRAALVLRRRKARERQTVRAAHDEQKQEQVAQVAASITSTRTGQPIHDRTADAVVRTSAAPQPHPDRPPAPPLPRPPRLPIPHVQSRAPPEPPSVERAARTPVFHNWIPERYGNTELRDRYHIGEIATLWNDKVGRDGPFDEGTTHTPQTFIDAIELRKTGSHNYAEQMPTVFHTLADYVGMWTAVIAVTVYNMFYDVTVAAGTWTLHDVHDGLVNHDTQYALGMCTGPDGFVVNTLPNPEDSTLLLDKTMDGIANDTRGLPVRHNDIVIARIYQVQRPKNRRRGANQRLNVRHVTTYLGYVRNCNARESGPALHENANNNHVRNDCTVTIGVVGYPTNKGTGARLPGIKRAVVSTTQTYFCALEVAGYLGNLNRAVQGLRQLQVNSNPRLTSAVTNNLLPVTDGTTAQEWLNRMAKDQINTTIPPEVGTIQQLRAELNRRIEATCTGNTAQQMQLYMEHFLETPYHSPSAARLSGYNAVSSTQCLAIAAVVHRGNQNIPTAITDVQQQRTAFTNIVGPPGTGKTRTLIHCVSVIMSSAPAIREPLFALRRSQIAYRDGRRVSPRNTRVSREMNDRAVIANSPKILILAPTHRALDVIETKFLQDRVYIYHEEDRRYLDVIPPYRRVGLQSRPDTNHVLERLRNENIPTGYISNPNVSIVLSTMGSLHLAFNRNGTAEDNRYDYIFIDEASQVSELDMLSLYNELCRAYDGALPKICKFGDTLQLPPMAHGTPSMYKLITQCSTLERELPDATPGLPGRNSVTCVLLDVQFRMHTSISTLANSLSQRDVATRIVATNHYAAAQIQAPRRYFNGNLYTLTDTQILTNPVVFFNAYTRRIELEDTNLYIGLDDEFGEGHEHSLHEAAFVMFIVRQASQQHNIPLDDILILTPYNAQRRLIMWCLREEMPDLTRPNNDDTPFFNVHTQVCTVDSAQGKEAYMVLFSPGKWSGRNNTNTVADHSLLNSLREIYVLITRAKRHMFIVGDYNFLRNQCPRWGPVLDYVRHNPAHS